MRNALAPFYPVSFPRVATSMPLDVGLAAKSGLSSPMARPARVSPFGWLRGCPPPPRLGGRIGNAAGARPADSADRLARSTARRHGRRVGAQTGLPVRTAQAALLKGMTSRGSCDSAHNGKWSEIRQDTSARVRLPSIGWAEESTHSPCPKCSRKLTTRASELPPSSECHRPDGPVHPGAAVDERATILIGMLIVVDSVAVF